GRSGFNAPLFGRKYPAYVAFDLLFYERKDIRPLPLKERRSILDQVAKRYSIQKSDLFTGCSKKLYKTVCVLDLGGGSSRNSMTLTTPSARGGGRCRIPTTPRKSVEGNCSRGGSEGRSRSLRTGDSGTRPGPCLSVKKGPVG